METPEKPKTWLPYMNTKDCSQGFCSISCPKWCYLIFPPPPPPPSINSQHGLNFSPLVIAIIGILTSALLLVSYYAIISKYCGNSRTRENQPPNEETYEDNHNNNNESWVITTNGLDEALIKAITLVKYNKGDGLIESTDCSICLGEFLQDEMLRLLPKCSHAFHLACVDTWLKSHSNCPLCRANILSSTFAQPSVPQVESEGVRSGNGERREMGAEEQTNGILPKSPFRGFTDLGSSRFRESVVIDVRDYGGESCMLRRSFSMDCFQETRASISGYLGFNGGEDCQVGNRHLHDLESMTGVAGESSQSVAGSSSTSRSVKSSVALKRSFSSGRFWFSKHGRGKNSAIPLYFNPNSPN